MNFFESTNARLLVFFVLLAVFTCSPIWAVDYFINQDGSGHVYSASLMTGLLQGNPAVSEVYTFNSISFPNSSGHWILVGLLVFFSPFTATKIIVTFTYLGLVAAVGWLRLRTVGREGVVTSLLIGAAIGFNWLWLMGFYNFTIGVIGFTFTLALYYRWREDMNAPRALMLAALLVLVYFSHIIGFGILAVSICLLGAFVQPSKWKKTILWTALAFLPIVPLLIIYKLLSEAGGGFSPVWRNLSDPYSISSWITQIRSADLFVIISRKTFPFTDANSSVFAVFTPGLWLLGGIFCLSAATWFSFRRRRDFLKTYYAFAVLFAVCVFIAMFAPDDFQLTHGGVLRERFLLCGLIAFVPLFRTDSSRWLKRFAQFCLGVVIVFQTLALWEYSLHSDKLAKDLVAAQPMIEENTRLVSISIIEDGLRYHSLPTGQMDNYLGIGDRGIQVWDNYEIGHYLFPIVAKEISHRQFVLGYTGSNVFALNDKSVNFDEKLSKLAALLEANNNKIDTLLVWGKDARVEAVLSRWFESEPYFQSGEVRLFRHR
ncbi:MAG: hypothetical protein M3384_06560 [Acidobacteriota bacterium]|nr:hypothetical protein [Acidobacteriota bacterium]